MAMSASQGIWLARKWTLRKRAKSMGVNFDELPEARRYQWPRYTDEEESEAQHTTATIGTKTETGLPTAGIEKPGICQ